MPTKVNPFDAWRQALNQIPAERINPLLEHYKVKVVEMKPITSHRAASLERQAWIAKLKREIKDCTIMGHGAVYERLLKWGEARVRRFDRKKGGLGK